MAETFWSYHKRKQKEMTRYPDQPARIPIELTTYHKHGGVSSYWANATIHGDGAVTNPRALTGSLPAGWRFKK